MRVLPSLARKTRTAPADRRAFRRVDVRCPIRLEASLDTPTTHVLRLVVSGLTVDLSRGGLLASLPESLAPGVPCQIRFLRDEGRVGPPSVTGRVRRLAASGDGSLVAVEFDEALEQLEPEEDGPGRSLGWPRRILSAVFSL